MNISALQHHKSNYIKRSVALYTTSFDEGREKYP